MEHSQIEFIGYCGTAFTVLSYSMRTIIPLRLAGIFSSVMFIWYGASIESWPMLVTEFIILPLNILRLMQVLKLVRQVRSAPQGEMSPEWLLPFSRDRRYRAGDIVFRAGEVGEYLLLIQSGRFRLTEAGIGLGSGELVGELGFLSPGNKRTMSLECVEDGVVGRVTYFDLKQLYFANPEFAYYFLRLISQRLFDNLERAQKAQAAA